MKKCDEEFRQAPRHELAKIVWQNKGRILLVACILSVLISFIARDESPVAFSDLTSEQKWVINQDRLHEGLLWIPDGETAYVASKYNIVMLDDGDGHVHFRKAPQVPKYEDYMIHIFKLPANVHFEVIQSGGERVY